MRHWKQILLIVMALFLLLAAGVAIFGPGLLRDRAISWVRSETGRDLEIGNVSVNLLALKLELHDVVLTEADQTTPFVSWKHLTIALSPRSLWHRAPVIRELQLDQPFVRMARYPQGRFNYSDLFVRPGTEESGTETEPVRFFVNNLVVHDGRLDVIDQTLEVPTTHRIENLELAVPFFGNLPYLADRYVQPLLQATVNGTPFELKGELKPFADSQEYLLKLKFDRIDLPRYLAYLPEPLPVTVHGGRLYLDLDLVWRLPAEADPVMEIAGRADLTVLDLREHSGRPLLFLPLLAAQVAPTRPLDGEIHLAKLTLNNLQGWLDRESSGTWNLDRIATADDEVATTNRSDREGGAPPFQVTIDQLQIRNSRLSLRDNGAPGGFRTEANAINIDLTGVAVPAAAPGRLHGSLQTGRGETLQVDGQLAFGPFACDLEIQAANLPLDAYRPYYFALTTAPVKGTIDLAGRLHYSPDQPLLLSEGRLELRDGDLPFGKGEGASVSRLTIDGVRYDSGTGRLDLKTVALVHPKMRFSRSPEGHWSFMDRRYPLLAALAEPAAAIPAGKASPFHWHIGRLTVADGAIGFRDLWPGEETGFAVTGLQAAISDLAAPAKVRSRYELSGTVNRKGRVKLDGTAVAATAEMAGSIAVVRLPLRPFAPYLARHTQIVLVDGELSADIDVRFAPKNEQWHGTFAGGLDVRRFHALDALHREDLMHWGELRIEGLDGSLVPPALSIDGITIDDYYAKVLLDEEARLNLVEAFAAPAGDAPGEPEADSNAAPGPTTRLSIGHVTLQGGRVNFTDRHIPRPFTAEMHELGGRIAGLSSDPAARAEVDLRGQLQGRSPLAVRGTLNPLAKPLFIDLSLLFNDIELSPLSPYSGTYVGYLIDKGKLNVELRYHVEQGKLDSTNQIFLDQFTFGEKVESDKATSLPVRLAVALLKDRNGEIHLDIPVTGDLDDPQFSVWKIIWQIVKNLLVKAATSPLALLGALTGGGEEFDAIDFLAGTAQLTAAEAEKLEKIAAALRDRPALQIEVRGYVDPDRDPEGYRRERLHAELRRAKYLDLIDDKNAAAPTSADAVTLSAEEYPDYLWEVYKAADFPRPRNFIGMTKHLPDAELEKLLLANTRAGDEELTKLAEARARAVAAALTTGGGIATERVFLVRPDVLTAPDGKGATRGRVEFGITVK